MAIINLNSVMDKVRQYTKSDAGNKRMIGYIKHCRENGKSATEAGAVVVTEQDMIRAAEALIKILQETASQKGLPESVMEHFYSLYYSEPIPCGKEGGQYKVDVQFGDDLSRMSLRITSGKRKGERTGEPIENIVSLFDTGYDTSKRNYLNCRFINPEKLVFNDGVVGYKATLEADSSMFWQDAITKTFTIQNDDPTMSSSIVVKVDTDLDDYIYPKVSFTLGSYGGDVIITNHSDDSTRLTKFVGLSPFATVTMRGELNYVSGQYYEKFYKSNFIRLLDGANNLSVMGDVQTITIEFQNRRAF